MLDSKLLEILVCPSTKQPVRMAEEALVKQLNEGILSKSLKNRQGSEVTESIDGALITEDGTYVYPIRSNIPVMLIDEAIAVEQVANS